MTREPEKMTHQSAIASVRSRDLWAKLRNAVLVQGTFSFIKTRTSSERERALADRVHRSSFKNTGGATTLNMVAIPEFVVGDALPLPHDNIDDILDKHFSSDCPVYLREKRIQTLLMLTSTKRLITSCFWFVVVQEFRTNVSEEYRVALFTNMGLFYCATLHHLVQVYPDLSVRVLAEAVAHVLATAFMECFAYDRPKFTKAFQGRMLRNVYLWLCGCSFRDVDVFHWERVTATKALPPTDAQLKHEAFVEWSRQPVAHPETLLSSVARQEAPLTAPQASPSDDQQQAETSFLLPGGGNPSAPQTEPFFFGSGEDTHASSHPQPSSNALLSRKAYNATQDPRGGDKAARDLTLTEVVNTLHFLNHEDTAMATRDVARSMFAGSRSASDNNNNKARKKAGNSNGHAEDGEGDGGGGASALRRRLLAALGVNEDNNTSSTPPQRTKEPPLPAAKPIPKHQQLRQLQQQQQQEDAIHRPLGDHSNTHADFMLRATSPLVRFFLQSIRDGNQTSDSAVTTLSLVQVTPSTGQLSARRNSDFRTTMASFSARSSEHSEDVLALPTSQMRRSEQRVLGNAITGSQFMSFKANHASTFLNAQRPTVPVCAHRFHEMIWTPLALVIENAGGSAAAAAAKTLACSECRKHLDLAAKHVFHCPLCEEYVCPTCAPKRRRSIARRKVALSDEADWRQRARVYFGEGVVNTLARPYVDHSSEVVRNMTLSDALPQAETLSDGEFDDNDEIGASMVSRDTQSEVLDREIHRQQHEQPSTSFSRRVAMFQDALRRVEHERLRESDFEYDLVQSVSQQQQQPSTSTKGKPSSAMNNNNKISNNNSSSVGRGANNSNDDDVVSSSERSESVRTQPADTTVASVDSTVNTQRRQLYALDKRNKTATVNKTVSRVSPYGDAALLQQMKRPKSATPSTPPPGAPDTRPVSAMSVHTTASHSTTATKARLTAPPAPRPMSSKCASKKVRVNVGPNEPPLEGSALWQQRRDVIRKSVPTDELILNRGGQQQRMNWSQKADASQEPDTIEQTNAVLARVRELLHKSNVASQELEATRRLQADERTRNSIRLLAAKDRDLNKLSSLRRTEANAAYADVVAAMEVVNAASEPLETIDAIKLALKAIEATWPHVLPHDIRTSLQAYEAEKRKQLHWLVMVYKSATPTECRPRGLSDVKRTSAADEKSSTRAKARWSKLCSAFVEGAVKDAFAASMTSLSDSARCILSRRKTRVELLEDDKQTLDDEEAQFGDLAQLVDGFLPDRSQRNEESEKEQARRIMERRDKEEKWREMRLSTSATSVAHRKEARALERRRKQLLEKNQRHEHLLQQQQQEDDQERRQRDDGDHHDAGKAAAQAATMKWVLKGEKRVQLTGGLTIVGNNQAFWSESGRRVGIQAEEVLRRKRLGQLSSQRGVVLK
eukprot:PhM_4_TR5145/c7_g1_i1/m.75525